MTSTMSVNHRNSQRWLDGCSQISHLYSEQLFMGTLVFLDLQWIPHTCWWLGKEISCIYYMPFISLPWNSRNAHPNAQMIWRIMHVTCAALGGWPEVCCFLTFLGLKGWGVEIYMLRTSRFFSSIYNATFSLGSKIHSFNYVTILIKWRRLRKCGACTCNHIVANFSPLEWYCSWSWTTATTLLALLHLSIFLHFQELNL